MIGCVPSAEGMGYIPASLQAVAEAVLQFYLINRPVK
jgi:hypothetical protein